MKDNPQNNIFSEDFDYNQTGDVSIWGSGDKDSLIILNKLIKAKKIRGKCLHFAAGDGRYNNLLLTYGDSVVATDIDPSALEKLIRLTPLALRTKLSIKVQDINQNFPFSSQSFDLVFNTGTLHLFPESVLRHIFTQVSRILKKNALFIFDFATDIERIKKDGNNITRSRVKYTQDTAKILLENLLTAIGFNFDFFACIVPAEEVILPDNSYTFSCKYWFVIARKK